MILLDTCVVAEALKTDRDSALVSWLDNQSADTLFISATSVAALLCGVAALPGGKRKKQIGSAFEMLLTRLFSSRILPFDQHAAISYGELVGTAHATGMLLSISEGQIAAIAVVHSFVVATRHNSIFESLGIKTINPWASLVK